MSKNESCHWKVLHRDLLLAREPWMQIYQERVELPNQHVIDDFYRIVLPDFVSIVAVTKAGEFVMVRGYKHGVGRVILSPPAGLMDPGEEPLETAKRELLEETGFEAPTWESLGTYVVDGNRQCGTMHLFVARDARWTRKQELDDSESLSLELLTREQVIAALRKGEIGNLVGSSSVAMALTLAQLPQTGQLPVAG